MILKGEWGIGYTDLVKYEIHLEHDHPIKKPVRYINLRLADWFKKELKRIETMEVIWKSYNPYTSFIIIVEVKKSDRTIKIYLCSDVTDLNKVTIKDAGPISHQ